MKLCRIFALFFVTVIGVSFQSDKNPAQTAYTTFGISLTRSYESGMVTYALITVNKGEVVSKKFLRRSEFVQMIVGRIPNAANPDRKNLFVENGLDTCVVYVSDVQNKYNGHICPPLDNLWKIKYKEHPVKKGLEEGWSQGYYSPSHSQLVFLNNQFNVISTTEYFYGEKMWELLRKMLDPDWIQKYKTVHFRKSNKQKDQGNSSNQDTTRN